MHRNLGSVDEDCADEAARFEDEERAQATLNSIGDAIMCVDVTCRITFLNAAAERVMGWSREGAAGRRVDDVLRIIDGTTREPVQNPLVLAIRENQTFGLTPNCVLIRPDGAEVSLEDSSAPIHGRQGEVAGAVMVFRDVSATRALTLKMSHLAQHDGLTDLPNRTLLIDRLDQAIVLARRHDRRLAVLFLDLDHFKRVNDSLGHVAGDRLLQSVAHRLLSCVRASDTVSRQGGDEFVILLSEITNTQDSATAAEKLLAALRTPVRIETHPLHATASIGIATYPEDGADAATLMVHADMALLHAKSSGRSKYQFFSPYMNVRDLGTDAHHAGLREPRRA